jgi:hypothetical protein
LQNQNGKDANTTKMAQTSTNVQQKLRSHLFVVIFQIQRGLVYWAKLTDSEQEIFRAKKSTKSSGIRRNFDELTNIGLKDRLLPQMAARNTNSN